MGNDTPIPFEKLLKMLRDSLDKRPDIIAQALGAIAARQTEEIKGLVEINKRWMEVTRSIVLMLPGTAPSPLRRRTSRLCNKVIRWNHGPAWTAPPDVRDLGWEALPYVTDKWVLRLNETRAEIDGLLAKAAALRAESEAQEAHSGKRRRIREPIELEPTERYKPMDVIDLTGHNRSDFYEKLRYHGASYGLKDPHGGRNYPPLAGKIWAPFLKEILEYDVVLVQPNGDPRA